jgi:3-hydroxyacyl-[acyl-carrier-protein] dehydratase
MPFLVEVRDAKLRSFVRPGTKLTVEARLEHDGSGFAVTKASIATEARAICDAEIRFRTLAFPSPALEQMMRDTAARIGLS